MFRYSSLNTLPRISLSCGKKYVSTSARQLAFDWEDPLDTKDLLTEDEIAISETARAYCQEKLLPRVLRKDMLFYNSIYTLPDTLNKPHLFC